MTALKSILASKSRWLIVVWFLASVAGLVRSLAVGRINGVDDPIALALALVGGVTILCYAWKNGAWDLIVNRLLRHH